MVSTQVYGSEVHGSSRLESDEISSYEFLLQRGNGCDNRSLFYVGTVLVPVHYSCKDRG
ncbi:hypothetical protein HY792_05785 [Candidatus Desantisbacteria bacterium]|nr:hypothetical protein [Candidatus Desantisbacteria bacterium]